VFRRERAKILAGFLARPRIFLADHFHQRYEARARANIGETLRRFSL